MSSDHVNFIVSTIGEDLTVAGNVSSKGDINLEGNVIGDVHCAGLTLGENSQLQGNVVAEGVVICGRLIGSVTALRVNVQSTAHVEGELVCRILALEQGAHFKGTSRPSDDPFAPSQVKAGDPRTNGQKLEERSTSRRDKPPPSFVRSLPNSELV
jgi:cytoskeletal protein CcmA (bactofilin family)